MGYDTVAAIATPLGSGGIGIIRISGKEALGITQAIFRPSCRKIFDPYPSHRFFHGWIRDPKSGMILDEVLMVYMQAPRSYTREDVAEIHTHSGPAALRSTLDLVLSRGARLADPGEFTKRAFLNGRIDLSQAEAVIDIVNAKTLVSLEIAAAQIHGGLRKKIETCRFALWELQTELSAAIDFPEEMETLFKAETAADRLKGQILSTLQELIKQHDQGRILREGIRVVVAGFPNVGKSSLMNCLLHRDRAIVSPYPGTTRDFLEEPLDLYGLQAMIVDTAGLQETDDPVERIGIEKTHEKIREADLLLFMVDVTQPIFIQKETIPVFEKPTILVVNKVDRVNSDRFPEIPKEWKRFPVVRISALTQYGVDALKEKIFERITQGKGFRQEDPIVPNLRQKLLLDRALKATEAALEGISYGRSPELVSMDVEEALDALNEILGETIRPDILDAIFSRFCIGK